MQNLLKNKLFIILSIFILLIGITSSCFATSNNVVNFHNSDFNRDIEVILPPGYGIDYKYYIMSYSFHEDDNCYFGNFRIICTDEPLYSHRFSDSYGDHLAFYNNSFTHFTVLSSVVENFRIYKNDKSKVTFDFSKEQLRTVESRKYLGYVYEGIDSNPFIAFSNYNIYDYKNRDELVFQGAPQKVEEVELTKIAQVEEIPQMITKILQMIIPIGLVVLSLGLLIYLIRLVISRLT